MNKLDKLALLNIMPSSISGDTEVQNIARTLDSKLQPLAKDINMVLLLPNLDILPEAVIDEMAYQYHVDFYTPDLELETKRRLVRQSIDWHRHKGTAAAVEGIVKAITGEDAQVREWYNYDGQPYYFKVDVLLSKNYSEALKQRVLEAIKTVKNTRSHLEKLIFYKEPLKQNPLFLNAGGPVTTVIIDLSTTTQIKHVVYDLGLNASNKAETITHSETITETVTRPVFDGATLPKMSLNKAGKKYETDGIATTQGADLLNSAALDANSQTIKKTVTTTEKLLKAFYTLNRIGQQRREMVDVGQDKTLEETLYTGPLCNGAGILVEITPVTTTKTTIEHVYTGGRLNARQKRPTLNNGRKERRTKTQSTTTLNCKKTLMGGATLGGRMLLNKANSKTTRRTVHFEEWRETTKTKGASLVNSTKHSSYIETIVHPAYEVRKTYPPKQHLLNGKQLLGYITL